MRFLQALLFGSGFVSTALLGAVSGAVASSTLLPHRAVYDLTLEHADEKSGISDVSGRMVYEFNGSACEGYTTNFRFVTRIDMDGEEQRITDQQSTTYETGDGERFRFVNKTFVDKELIKENHGSASLSDKHTNVTLTKPQKQEIQLPLSQFPTKHMEELIGKAEKGDSFYQSTIFDGSDDAGEIMAITSVIGAAQVADADEETKVMGSLGQEKSWPVTVAYFNDKENDDGLPVYRINFKLYRNGVTRDLNMDYGDFAMKGRLVNLEMFKPIKASETCN